MRKSKKSQTPPTSDATECLLSSQNLGDDYTLQPDPQPDPPPSKLTDVHDTFRRTYIPDCSDDEFIRNVCTSIATVAEFKVGNVQHFPACNIANGQLGWTPCTYLIIGPNVTEFELTSYMALPHAAESGRLVRAELANVGIPEDQVVVTHALRFAKQRGQTSYGQRHKKASAVYTKEDARQCKPKVIITCGADALRSLFGPDASLDAVRGSVQYFEGIPVVPTASYLQFLGGYADIDIFRSELRRAIEIANGTYHRVEIVSNYVIVDNLEKALNVEAAVKAAKPKRLAYDTEFGNDVAREEFTYVLSGQVCWKPGHAALYAFRGERGAEIHTPEQWAALRDSMGRLLKDTSYPLAGHHLRVDVQRSHEMGIDIDHRIVTGEDTLLAHHLIRGDSSQGLDDLCRRYTPEFGAYWNELESWLTANGRGANLKYGYRNVPRHIRDPYALIDADVGYRVADKVFEELQKQKDLWDLYWGLTVWTSVHLLDVERHGVLVDEERRTYLRETYRAEYEAILAEFRDSIRWPDFLPTQKAKVCELLYRSTNYKGKKEYLAKNPIPAEVIRFDFKPPFNTDKYPKEWAELEAIGEEELHSPSTKTKAIDVLINQNPDVKELKQLRQLSVLGKYLNTYLKERTLNEHGVYTDGKGFSENICADGRVRGHFNQNSETSRYRAYKANLQTVPKKQEAIILETFVDRRFGLTLKEYQARCNEKVMNEQGTPELFIPKEDRVKLHKFKSVHIASPGHLLIEVDFKTAEIAAWAFASNDPELIKVLDRGRDMHLEIAVRSFRLEGLSELEAALAALDLGDDTLYKNWTKAYKKRWDTQRTVAKSIIFGAIYGRGAASIARELVGQGITTTREECQGIIDTIAKTFSVGWAWIKRNQAHAIEHGWVGNPFGQRRYFAGSRLLNQREQGAIMREASNSPLQSCCSGESIVATNEGAVRLGDMGIGSIHKVTTSAGVRDAIVIDSGVKTTHLLKLSNGAAIRATTDHRFKVLREHGDEWVELQHLRPGDMVYWLPLESRTEFHHISATVPAAGRLNPGMSVELDLDDRFGWLLGYLVGNGSWSKSSHGVTFITRSDDPDVGDALLSTLRAAGIPCWERLCKAKDGHIPLRQIGVGHRVMREVLRQCGVEQAKHTVAKIPAKVWSSPESVRWAFIDGYLSADGTVAPDGTVTWVTSSYDLAMGLSSLIAHSGGSSKWATDKAGYYRGSMPGATRAILRSYGAFRHHARRRKWLDERDVGKMRSGSTNSNLVPNWYARRCSPAAAPSKAVYPSASTVWYRINSGGTTGHSFIAANAAAGFNHVAPVVPVHEISVYKEEQVYDISILTDSEDERNFVADGFTVHNCVACLLSQAGKLFYQYSKTEHGKRIGWKILIPIHDAFLIEVPKEHVEEMKVIIKMCMSIMNVVPGSNGRYLGVDLEVMERWGEELMRPA